MKPLNHRAVFYFLIVTALNLETGRGIRMNILTGISIIFLSIN